MKDSALLKIALIWSLIGIFILLLVAVYTEPREIAISELDKHIDEVVVVSGFIDYVNYKEKISFIDLRGYSGDIQIVVFDDMNKSISIGDQIAVKGKVSLYKGDLEIIADEIACLECG